MNEESREVHFIIHPLSSLGKKDRTPASGQCPPGAKEGPRQATMMARVEGLDRCRVSLFSGAVRSWFFCNIRFRSFFLGDFGFFLHKGFHNSQDVSAALFKAIPRIRPIRSRRFLRI